MVLLAFKGLSFSGLRDMLLTFGATDAKVVQAVNAAEAEFWKLCQGPTAIDDSDMVLGFDCGGSQLVNERAFPASDNSVTPPLSL